MELDFGDGQGFRGLTSDPVTGPEPDALPTPRSATYAVKVKIRNCVQAGDHQRGADRQHHPDDAARRELPGALFCQFSQCFATVECRSSSPTPRTGAEIWDYDWNHTSADAATCNFTRPGHTTAVASHTYTAVGNVYPCLRVTPRRRQPSSPSSSHSAINVGSPAAVAAAAAAAAATPSIRQRQPARADQPAITFAASASTARRPAPAGAGRRRRHDLGHRDGQRDLRHLGDDRARRRSRHQQRLQRRLGLPQRHHHRPERRRWRWTAAEPSRRQFNFSPTSPQPGAR